MVNMWYPKSIEKQVLKWSTKLFKCVHGQYIQKVFNAFIKNYKSNKNFLKNSLVSEKFEIQAKF